MKDQKPEEVKRNKFNYKFSTFLKNNDNENNDNGTENKGHMPNDATINDGMKLLNITANASGKADTAPITLDSKENLYITYSNSDLQSINISASNTDIDNLHKEKAINDKDVDSNYPINNGNQNAEDNSQHTNKFAGAAVPNIIQPPQIPKPSVPPVPSNNIINTNSINNALIPQIPKPGVPPVTMPGNIPQIPKPGVTPVPISGNIMQIPKPEVPPVPLPGNLPQIPKPGIPSIPVPGNILQIPKPGIQFPPPFINPNLFSLPPKEKKRPCNSMKSLQWQLIEPRQLKNSIWLELDDSSVDINAMVLEREFSLKQTTKIVEHKPIKIQKKTYFTDSKDLQMMNILIQKYKIDYIDVIDGLYSYNINYFSKDLCDALYSKLPKGDSMKFIPLIPDNSEEFEQLETADQIVQIFKKIKCADLRLQVMSFSFTYEDECKKLLKMAKKILKIFEIFSHSKSFRRWLEYILAYGNYLNGVSAKGGAYAFKLDTFNKITEIKSNENGKSLLQFIIEAICKNDKDYEILNFNYDIESLEGISFNGLAELHDQIKLAFIPLKTLSKEYIENNEEFIRLDQDEEDEDAEFDQTGVFIEKLLPEAQKYLEECQQYRDIINEKYKELITFFADDPNKFKIEDFFQIMLRFKRDLEAGKKVFLDNLARHNKLKK